MLEGQALAISRVYQAQSSLQEEKERLELENARIEVISEKKVVQLESERRTEQKQLNKAIIERQKKVEQANITLKQQEEEIKQIKRELALHKRRSRDVEEENTALQVQVMQVNTECEEIQKKARSEVERVKEECATIKRKLHQQQATQQKSESKIFTNEQDFNEQKHEEVCGINKVIMTLYYYFFYCRIYIVLTKNLPGC